MDDDMTMHRRVRKTMMEGVCVPLELIDKEQPCWGCPWLVDKGAEFECDVKTNSANILVRLIDNNGQVPACAEGKYAAREVLKVLQTAADKMKRENDADDE